MEASSIKSVGVIDIGLGNVKSVANMLTYIGARPISVKKIEDLNQCERVILPGVGSFDKGMDLLTKSGLGDGLNTARHHGVKIMGICLGMQLLANKSEEGSSSGLGWIDAEVLSFQDSKVLVPHMGWSNVRLNRNSPNSKVLKSIGSDSRFYFVHSYYMKCSDDSDVMLSCSYGDDEFVCGVMRGNVLGFQFHPEKSHRFGLELMKDFLEI